MQIKRIFDEIFNRLDSKPSLAKASTGTDKDLSLSEVEERLELLYAYIEAELDLKDAVTLFPRVHSALAVSAEAQIQYEDLKEILVAERSGTLSVPTRVPNFDFSYLTETAPKVGGGTAEDGSDPFLKAWQLDEKSGFINVDFSNRLITTFEPPSIRNAPLNAHLKSRPEGDMLFSYQIDQQEEKDLVISFVAFATAADSAHCNLTVTIDRPSLDGTPLLADSVIRLTCPALPSKGKGDSAEDASKPEQPTTQPSTQQEQSAPTEEETIVQSTDPFGEAVFRHIPIVDLPKLHFAIQPAPLM